MHLFIYTLKYSKLSSAIKQTTHFQQQSHYTLKLFNLVFVWTIWSSPGVCIYSFLLSVCPFLRWFSCCSAATCVRPCWNRNRPTPTECHLCILLPRTDTSKSYGLTSFIYLLMWWLWFKHLLTPQCCFLWFWLNFCFIFVKYVYLYINLINLSV